MTIQWRSIFPLFLGAAIWLLPVPAGLTNNAWAYFALCVAVIAALITEPIPRPVAGLLGITAAAALNLVAANLLLRFDLRVYMNAELREVTKQITIDGCLLPASGPNDCSAL